MIKEQEQEKVMGFDHWVLISDYVREVTVEQWIQNWTVRDEEIVWDNKAEEKEAIYPAKNAASKVKGKLEDSLKKEEDKYLFWDLRGEHMQM